MLGKHGCWIVATLAFATTLSGTDDHRVVLPEISRFTVEHGWHRLQDLPDAAYLRECSKRSCGLGVSSLLEPSCIKPGWINSTNPPSPWTRVWGPVLLWGATGIGLCITAAGLGKLSRPRYLVGLGMGLLLPIAASLANYSMRWAKAAGILLGLHMLLNTWGFFGQWGQVRQRMLGGNPPTIPTAPSIWAKIYPLSHSHIERPHNDGCLRLPRLPGHHAPN